MLVTLREQSSTAQKMKFSFKDFFSKCEQEVEFFLHLLKKSLMEGFIFLCGFKVS